MKKEEISLPQIEKFITVLKAMSLGIPVKLNEYDTLLCETVNGGFQPVISVYDDYYVGGMLDLGSFSAAINKLTEEDILELKATITLNKIKIEK